MEAITEELTKGGPPRGRFSLLEHRWTIPVPAGSRVEFHVEGFRSSGPDGDGFVFECSDDAGATWNPIPLSALPFSDDDTDMLALLPSNLSGAIVFRVVDTKRLAGGQSLETVSVDEMFVRTVP